MNEAERLTPLAAALYEAFDDAELIIIDGFIGAISDIDEVTGGADEVLVTIRFESEYDDHVAFLTRQELEQATLSGNVYSIGEHEITFMRSYQVMEGQ